MIDPRPPNAEFDVVAIGASAGGVQALHVVIPALPAVFPAAVLVVLHLDPRHESLLPSLLRRHAHLPVTAAVHGERIVGGTVYLAPADMHLLVALDRIELSHSRLVHFTRPSVDLLFESGAGAYGPRAIGVILTGSGVDGATGIRAIKRMGGRTIVQEPDTAAHAGMPRAALATGGVDQRLPLDRIAETLVGLVAHSAPGDSERMR